MSTPRSLKIFEVSGGNFVYFSIKAKVYPRIAKNFKGYVVDCSPIGIKLQSKVPHKLISLSLGLDGIPTTGSNNKSFWPILGRIDQFPFEKPFVIGMFHGKSKPSDTNFLTYLADEIVVLEKTGFQVDNEQLSFRISKILADAPARSFLKGVRTHNSYAACERCTQEADEQTKIIQLKTAVEEHSKENKSIDPKIQAELKRIASNPDLLFKYLRGRKLNVTRALDTIVKYAEVKFISYPQYFPNQVPDYVRFAIENKLVNLLSKKDELGRTYIYVDTTKYDDSVLTIEEVGNVARYLVETLMNSPEFLDNGIVMLEDSSGVKFKYGKQAPTCGEFYSNFWKAFPVRVKGLIHFNAPIYGKALFLIAKPFIKSRAIEKVYISSGFTELHKRVSLDILPQFLGGKLPNEVAFVPIEQLLTMAFGR
ncbi:Retinaldehyde-binding protein 1 [Orchesella cincta]|uniref:Retinaldehyde-binding protein 1 n=1 Tax=Orchesella cincta TaxID=48709 RepID=A0A1D2MNZ2_ORCCI|nr:Retinaldehyde-binding protein 1 [Orchesella cincta]